MQYPLNAGEIARDLAKFKQGYILVCLDKEVWSEGEFYVVGDEPHIYEDFYQACYFRNMYAADHNNEHIHVMEVKLIPANFLTDCYIANPYGEDD